MIPGLTWKLPIHEVFPCILKVLYQVISLFDASGFAKAKRHQEINISLSYHVVAPHSLGHVWHLTLEPL
jgi:hypothetical protein